MGEQEQRDRFSYALRRAMTKRRTDPRADVELLVERRGDDRRRNRGRPDEPAAWSDLATGGSDDRLVRHWPRSWCSYRQRMLANTMPLLSLDVGKLITEGPCPTE